MFAIKISYKIVALFTENYPSKTGINKELSIYKNLLNPDIFFLLKAKILKANF